MIEELFAKLLTGIILVFILIIIMDAFLPNVSKTMRMLSPLLAFLAPFAQDHIGKFLDKITSANANNLSEIKDKIKSLELMIEDLSHGLLLKPDKDEIKELRNKLEETQRQIIDSNNKRERLELLISQSELNENQEAWRLSEANYERLSKDIEKQAIEIDLIKSILPTNINN